MGANSVKGLKVMETIYPSQDGKSVFDNNPKLKAKLDKEMAKGHKEGGPKEPDPPEEDYVDGDLDAVVDRVIKSVWEYYDRKQKGFLDKKRGERFFKDGLEVYALRKGLKGGKEALGQGVNMKKALEDSFKKMNVSGSGKIVFQEFEEFLNCYDIEEAMQPFTGGSGVSIDPSKVKFVDTSQFRGQKKDGPKLVYRNYNQ
eukprot:TRINITY_DN931_c0_g2_i3.p1 TRINITY_DN931_c0_g2~~TRINITY_DN931_c0_g2_i3.p1  ORF type:complete len:225 (-),score=67.14 TRINITY_DN931_c0_g2_i3:37-636(-)